MHLGHKANFVRPCVKNVPLSMYLGDKSDFVISILFYKGLRE